ncbi:hypothetical protein BDB00DRAFT_803371 [Zychaea mexicana]|uniref:uncharacterized protein n=1 Tax=Zychaea mexicana TaxID=64656 RepID=UPI0022FEC6BC|nr:uncharacterized protein BDB00DRAFT_803371 [Zychaea mexicana]KAI9497615.1 hypothetical protein BDB00DRAFT_803371 [Zychaea mexicana]
MSTLGTHEVSKLEFGGPVDLIRCSPSYKYGCLCIIFDEPGITYENARDMLITYFTSYDNEVDAMRQKSTCADLDYDSRLIIELHLMGHYRGARRTVPYFRLPVGGSMSLSSDLQRAGTTVKVRTAIPPLPFYKVCTVRGLPLGAPREVRSDLLEAICATFQKRSTVKKGEILDEAVIDAVEICTTDKQDGNPLFDGSFYVIFNESLLPHFYFYNGPPSSFYLDDKEYFFQDNMSSHYMYCTSCKKVDSHLYLAADSC